MGERSVSDHLQGAEIWHRSRSGRREAGGPPVMLAGWEDGDVFCAAVCTNDVGLAFCRRCPEAVVQRVLETGRAARDRCRGGVGLLAFPAPRGSRDQVAVLRVSPPAVKSAASIAGEVRVAPATLRRAARQAWAENGRETLAAARILRRDASLRAWCAGTRHAAADRRRTMTAALAQMIVTGEEYYNLYQASQRQLSELRRNRRQVDDLSRAAFREQERERSRIAHQIHDTAAQSMVSAFRYMEAARALADAREPRLAGALEAATQRLGAAIHEVRAVLNRILPPGLEELGLATAIDARLRVLASEGGRQQAVMRGQLPRLEPWVEQALYGMAIEAITNAVRHADASQISVSLGAVRGRAVIEVRDDGDGFDPGALRRRSGRGDEGGLGLMGIARQAEWLGGRATVHSSPGTGTRVRISVPIDRHRPATAASADGAVVAPGTEART